MAQDSALPLTGPGALVVEDDYFIAGEVEAVLTEAGAQGRSLPNGERGVALGGREPFRRLPQYSDSAWNRCVLGSAARGIGSSVRFLHGMATLASDATAFQVRRTSGRFVIRLQRYEAGHV